MGASIAMALGAARAGAHPVIATIGDSTFTHSAMPALLQAAAEDAPMTVVIMDNASVAMTGGQKGLVTGDALIRLLRGLGVDARHIVGIEPVEKEHDKNVGLVRAEIEHRGLSVILACRPCIHWKRRAGSVGRLETSTASA
jgi:indolepyruvate ferredoxin oxidoreductase alpha subunit